MPVIDPGDRKPATRHALVLCMVFIASGAGYYKIAHRSPPASFQVPATVQEPDASHVRNMTSGIRTHFISRQQNISSHAASLVELSDGRIRAFWFAGSSEGAQDVEIRSAVYDPVTDAWGAERSIASREDTQRSLLRYVKKLGNPVALHAQDGKLWLFYVTVSVGGWAGSSITAITSGDDGATWGPARRLITSPFTNISTLVKGTPFLYGDGSIGLPVYHEFIGKFAELLRIDGDGGLIDKQRLTSGKSTLQPVVLITGPQRALVLMRRTGSGPKRVIATETEDGGQHWSEPSTTALDNPDAAISGVALPNGRILVVLNNIEDGRDALSLVVSSDGGATWKSIYQLEDQRGKPTDLANYLQAVSRLAAITESGITDAEAYAKSAQRNKCEDRNCAFEFSYPYLIRAHNGDFHLAYTWNRSFIKHVRFTRAWLDQRIERNADAALH
ncbi:MAG TPA: sialidase family protein [Gallionella sp.]|nr:sialidase family protein [Gallionella sp.]